jgi:hypothetical protein
MIWEEKSYVTCGSLTTIIGWRWQSAWRSSRWRRWPMACVRRRGRRAVMKNLKKRASGREDRFPKTLFTLSWCRIANDDSFRDLLSRSHGSHTYGMKQSWWRNNWGDERLDALVACGCLLLVGSWQPHIFIGKICLGLQRHVGLSLLRLELQVWCKQVLLKAPTDTWPSVDYFAGGAYISYSLVSSWA